MKLEKTLIELGKDDSVHGIIMLSPLPKGPEDDLFDEVVARSKIIPEKDMDALSYNNTAMLYLKGEEPLSFPPTIGGVLLALDLYGIDIRKKRVAIMGRGNLVGRPMGLALMDEYNCTITYVHTGTENPQEILMNSEVIVGATGKAHILDADDIPEGAILLDMGVYYKDSKMVGDFTPAAYDKAYAALKTPGGSGTMTVLYLLMNCLKAAERTMSES